MFSHLAVPKVLFSFSIPLCGPTPSRQFLSLSLSLSLSLIPVVTCIHEIRGLPLLRLSGAFFNKKIKPTLWYVINAIF